jgi:hypothetical protein
VTPSFERGDRIVGGASTVQVGLCSCHDPRAYLLGDPCVIVVRRADGTVVARFTNNVDPEQIRRAAEEDQRGPAGA